MRRSMLVGVMCVMVALIGGTACSSGDESSPVTNSGGSSGGSSSGLTSSSSSSSSGTSGQSSGSGTTAGACTHDLAPAFFDGAPALAERRLQEPPCPAGYDPVPAVGGGVAPAPSRFADQTALTAAICKPSKAAGAGGKTTVDFAINDVVTVSFLSYAFNPPEIVTVANDLWVQLPPSPCGGMGPSVTTGYYVVPKGQTLNVQSCPTTCHCDMCP